MSTFFPGKYLCGEFMDMCKTKQDSGIQQSRLYPENLRFYEDLQVSEREEEPLSRLERLKNVEKPLLSWYHSRARSLPWRDDPKPYRVWISEIMLQQTRVEAVKPYFERFMNAFPDVKALAEADDDYLMKMWEGLGYYNRARNLKAAAVMVMEEFNGQIPAEKEELLKLPGIGSYTAGAISSIAYGIPNPAVDGNVLRVISRITESTEDISKQSVRKKIEQQLQQIMPSECPGDFNQALIELGATVCVPNGQPLCDQCPWDTVCKAYKEDLIDQLPVKTPKKARRIEHKTVFLLECGEQIAIHKRGDKGLLAGLWEFPNEDKKMDAEDIKEWMAEHHMEDAKTKAVGKGKHIFSHVEWHMEGVRISLKTPIQSENYVWVLKKELENTYALPSAFEIFRKIL